MLFRSTAKRDARVARVARKQNLSKEDAAKVIDSVDRARDNFVQTVAETSRYDARNYNFVFDVTGMDPEKVASFIAENIRNYGK